MKSRRSSLPMILAASFFPIVSWADQPAYSLQQCFDLAIARSTTVASQVQAVEQAEARISQARAGFMPNFSGSAQTLQEAVPSNAFAVGVLPSNQNTVKATANLNLFRGFKDFASLKQKNLQRDYYEREKFQATVQLFSDTAQSFFNVRAYEHDLANYREEIQANLDRKKQLTLSRRLARARESDIVSVESAIAGLESSIASTKGLLNAELETLSYLTGVDPDNLKLLDDEKLPTQLPQLDVWLASLDFRPDVKAAVSDRDSSKESVEINRSAYLPSLDLQGNYYPERTGLYQGVNWDTSLTLTIPIWDGGLTSGQVREAKSQVISKEIALDQTRRQAVQQIRSVYRTTVANLDQIEKLRNAVRLSRRNYELFVRDNRSGLVTNIDVLTALATFSQNQRALDRAVSLARFNIEQLAVISAKRDISGRASDNFNNGSLK